MPTASSDSQGPRPSIITALELLGIDASDLPEERARWAVSRFVLNLGDSASDPHERSVVLLGARALRVAPIKPGGTLLFWEMLDVLHLQADLINAGVHLTGAIVLGDATVRPALGAGRGITAARADVFLGPGIGEAERLRDTVAEVPRVIVDPRLFAETEANSDLRARHHTVAEELGYIHDVLRADADGLWFVDYLHGFRDEVDEPHLYLEFLADHASLVRRRLANLSTLDREAKRWMWSWRYHNSTIDDLWRKELITFEDRRRLRIPAASPLFYSFPRATKAE